MALGRARLEQPSRFLVDNTPLAQADVAAELVRIDNALALARAELKGLRDKLSGPLAREVAEFIDAHGLILADPEFVNGLHNLIKDGRFRASAALKMQRDSLVAVFEAMDDPYLRSRREDIEHVIGRVQGALSRESSVEERKLASRVGEILVSDTVAPAELCAACRTWRARLHSHRRQHAVAQRHPGAVAALADGGRLASGTGAPA